ncbi:MAG: GntR family transcriptional regulator [Spirochaetia bacterium]
MKDDGVLTFNLDPKSGVPYYKQIIQQVEMAVADGRLKYGSQLPTVRGLAVDIQVNPNTVARAYNELEIRGIVNTQQGTGTFISNKKISLSQIEKLQILSRICKEFYTKLTSYGFSLDEALELLKEYQSHPSRR